LNSLVMRAPKARGIKGKRMRKIFIVAVLTFAVTSQAQGPSTEPLSFKSWKEQQIIEAQNHVARISNRLVLLKAGKVQAEEVSAEFNNFLSEKLSSETPKLTSKAQKFSSKDVQMRLEMELSRTQKGLDYAKELGLSEYFLGYLVQFQENPEAIAAVAGRLSKEEVAELLKALLKANQPSLGGAESRRLRSALGQLETSNL
jgi:hypothetical protein